MNISSNNFHIVDWHELTPAEQNSVKDFLLERFAVDDLELAYDEFFPRHGKYDIPFGFFISM